MNFAENVKSEMEYQGIQMKELSEKTGISKNTLDKYLTGRKVQPGVENAVKIAKALKVSVEYLVCNENEQNIPKKNLLTKNGQTIILQYQKLNDFNKKTVEDLLKSLLSRQN